MARFPGVSRATFFRYVKEVKDEIEARASARGTAELKLAQQRIRSTVESKPENVQKKIKAHLPATPSPAVIASMPGELVESTFNFMAYFHEIVRDMKMVRDASVVKNEDGTERLKNPMLMGNSAAQRLKAIETWIRSMELMYSFERNQEFQRIVLEEISRVDPALQQAILARLREADNRIGFTPEARIR